MPFFQEDIDRENRKGNIIVGIVIAGIAVATIAGIIISGLAEKNKSLDTISKPNKNENVTSTTSSVIKDYDSKYLITTTKSQAVPDTSSFQTSSKPTEKEITKEITSEYTTHIGSAPPVSDGAATPITQPATQKPTKEPVYQHPVQPTTQKPTETSKIPETLSLNYYHDISTMFEFSSEWSAIAGTDYSGNLCHYTYKPNASVSFSFVGRQFQIEGSKVTNGGKIQISVDDAVVATVSTQSQSVQHKQILYSSDILSTGTHSVTIVYTSKDNPKGGIVYIDGFYLNED